MTRFFTRCILVLIAFLAIFNAVRISSLKASIQNLDSEIYYNEQVINSKISEYNALTDESLLQSKSQSLGFDEIASENNHSVKIRKVKSNLSDNASQGENWFDRVCSFIAGLFGA